MPDYIQKPCKHCPFRSDVKPFLHPERAEEIAYAAQNPYSIFWCHKTTEYDDECDDTVVVETTKICAGFLTLRAQELDEKPEGFEPSYDICYTDSFEMIQAYEEEWEKSRNKSKPSP